MKLAVIPARGGSKRIPRKNIKEFCGKPMIAWSIEAARMSGMFDHIIVSTDDHEIAEVARLWGGEVPFMRPAELSGDYVGTTEVVTHATQWAVKQGWPLTEVCCILATAPFIRASDIKKGFDLLNAGDQQYVIAATDYAAPIFRSFYEKPDGRIEMFFPEHLLTRSQDLPKALHDAGQFYWGKASAWLEGKRGFESHSVVLKIPRWRVQDIDDEEDWKRAELIASQIMLNSAN